MPATSKTLIGFLPGLGNSYGRSDILFADAGVGEFAPIDRITEAHFDNRLFLVRPKWCVRISARAFPFAGLPERF